MDTLFPIPSILPKGFYYYPAFISMEEETILSNEIAKLDFHRMKFQGYVANRRVASFGYDYNFENRKLTEGKPIPIPFKWLIDRVAEKLQIDAREFAELLVTEYPIGSVINWHRDAPPFNIIAGISLSSVCKFRLRPYDKAKQNRKAIVSLDVQPRSLYIIRDEARSEWEHSTAPVKQVRYSITLRTLKAS